MEQRKFVVPEVVVGKNVMELIGRYLGHFGSKKTMIVTDKNILKLNWFQNIINNLMKKDIEYIIFDEVSENPRDYEAMLGAELFLAEDCDSIVAVGGGSPMDCAKCISIVCTNGGHILDYVGVDQIRLPGPPLICIPSTAGTAADVSQFAIILDSKIHIKKAIISKKVVPDLALIDTIPLITMDTYLTECTGMDALTHAIEAYVSNAASPLTDVHALKAIELIKKALPNAVSSNKEEVMEFFGGSDKLKDYVDGEYQEELVALTGFARFATILNNVKSFYARRSTKRPSKASVQVTISGNLYSVNKAYLESIADMDKEAKREALLAHAETKPVETIESLWDIDSQ